MHNGRAVIGMWLIDGATEQDDVIQIHSRIPMPIEIRQADYLMRKEQGPPA